jgi:hypothetical protein
MHERKNDPAYLATVAEDRPLGVIDPKRGILRALLNRGAAAELAEIDITPRQKRITRSERDRRNARRRTQRASRRANRGKR